MVKSFNVTGICVPEKHYMADISAKLQEITETLIDTGAYFTINRARQYGKTTTLFLLERKLQEKYIVLSLSFEAADDLFVSMYTLATGLVRRIGRKLKMQTEDRRLLEAWNAPLSREFALDEFSDRITELCAASDREIILMIDEVDKSSGNQVFLSFLGLLRAKYLDQQKGQDHTFKSVILAGVYDIKNLKLKSNSGQERKHNSPWNIAADFTIKMEFSREEISSMLREYEYDHYTGMDLDEMAELLYDYTSGYPFLVSRLCKYLDEEISKDAQTGEKRTPWTKTGFHDAVRMILSEKNTLFESLTGKLADYPELDHMLRTLLFTGKTIAYNADEPAMDMATMFGFIKNYGGTTVIANRIFETRLYNLYLSTAEMQNKDMYKASLQDKNQFIEDGHLNMRRVLERFVVHFYDLYGDSNERFLENEGRKYFLLYLRPIINGVGNYYIESQTRGLRRTDVIVDYHGEQYVIEMKVWHGNEYNSCGEKQLVSYLDDYHKDKGYMVSFNFNRKKRVGVREIIVGDKILIEAMV